MHKQEDTRCHCETCVKTSVKLSLCSQGDKSLHQCLEEIKNTIEQAEGHGMEFGNEDKIQKTVKNAIHKIMNQVTCQKTQHWSLG